MQSRTAVRGTARARWAAIVVVMTVLGGCDEGGGGGAGSSASAAKTGEAKPGDTKTADTKSAKPAVTLKYADVEAAYEKEINDFAKMKDPMDKKIEAFVAKIGKPEKEDGGKKIWHAVDGSKCMKITIESSGAKTDETVDKAECGL